MLAAGLRALRAPASRTLNVSAMSLISLLLTTCALPTAHSVSAQDGVELREVPAPEVLESARQVLGTGRLNTIHEGVRVAGTCLEQGIEGDFELLFDGAGRFRHGVRSELGETVAFDGETAWSRDLYRVVRRLSFGARVSTQSWIWVQTGRWALEDGPFEVRRLEGYPAPEGTIPLRVSRTDEPWSATLILDATSFLPRELVCPRPTGERRYRFEKWANALGLRYPGLVEVTGVTGDVSRFEATTIEKAPTFVRSPYEPVFQRPIDTVFEGPSPGTVPSRRAPTGHLLVHPRVNQQDVGWFVLDSGAGAMCIDPGIADRLRMGRVGEVNIVGVGGATRGSFRRRARVAAGPLTLPDFAWVELETASFEKILGAPVAGILGYELFARAVVAIDMKTGRVELSDPTSFKGSFDPARWLPLRFDDRIPCIEVSFEGDRSGWFRVDTGSDDSLILHTPAVDRLGLLEGRETKEVEHAGVGGRVQARRGELAWVELAGRRFENVPTTFSTATESGLATPYTTGTLGSGLLEHFRLVFDYGGERVALLPVED